MEVKENHLLSVEDLAAYLHIPKSWIYEKARKGSSTVPVPSIRVGKYLRFDLNSVLRWLDETRGLERKDSDFQFNGHSGRMNPPKKTNGTKLRGL